MLIEGIVVPALAIWAAWSVKVLCQAQGESDERR